MSEQSPRASRVHEMSVQLMAVNEDIGLVTDLEGLYYPIFAGQREDVGYDAHRERRDRVGSGGFFEDVVVVSEHVNDLALDRGEERHDGSGRQEDGLVLRVPELEDVTQEDQMGEGLERSSPDSHGLQDGDGLPRGR